MIEVAKNKIYDGEKTINQIAYELGFKYTQHFIRHLKNVLATLQMSTARFANEFCHHFKTYFDGLKSSFRLGILPFRLIRPMV
ncbi:hypothetical protein [Pedobacter sp. BAL39]|uniref:hypothetical protein n=1 Tax=Pedobacter sp. BAL39 TaxID=391596 RepID=UPI00031F6E57